QSGAPPRRADASADGRGGAAPRARALHSGTHGQGDGRRLRKTEGTGDAVTEVAGGTGSRGENGGNRGTRIPGEKGILRDPNSRSRFSRNLRSGSRRVRPSAR